MSTAAVLARLDKLVAEIHQAVEDSGDAVLEYVSQSTANTVFNATSLRHELLAHAHAVENGGEESGEITEPIKSTLSLHRNPQKFGQLMRVLSLVRGLLINDDFCTARDGTRTVSYIHVCD